MKSHSPQRRWTVLELVIIKVSYLKITSKIQVYAVDSM